MMLGHGQPGQTVSRGGTCLCPDVCGKTSRGGVERSRLEVGGPGRSQRVTQEISEHREDGDMGNHS